MNVAKLQLVAQKRLLSDGNTCTLNPKVNQKLDPTTGDMVPVGPAPTSSTFYGIAMGVTDSYIDGRTREWSDQYKNSTEIETLKAKVFLSPGAVNPDGSFDFTIVPNIGDQLVMFSGPAYDVLTVTPLSPTGIILGWELGLT